MSIKHGRNLVETKRIASRWRKKGFKASSPYKVKKGYAISVHRK